LAQRELWNLLAKPTLWLVHSLLGLVFSDLEFQPEINVVGTNAFSARISFACSGIEGITLITIFLSIYLFLFRKILRFPHAFWLFPAGIAAIWLANAVRIALLIVIGTSISPEMALGGGHAQGGWIAFVLVSVGAIGLSHNRKFFSAASPDSDRTAVTATSSAAAFLVPFLALMAISMVTAVTFTGFDLWYPLRVLVAAAVLWHFRKYYRGLGWTWSWHAPMIGVAVFVLWMLLEPDGDQATSALARGLMDLPAWGMILWLAVRVLGSVITIPLVEELAFRGYLMRKLVAENFERVGFKQFTWLSFSVSSVLFGLLHERWIAGTLAGMGYALILYRRGQFSDAVVAHATTNGLIAIWVLAFGKFNLWS
jgi:exosortase E/protease (VPEID-CTERM system)